MKQIIIAAILSLAATQSFANAHDNLGPSTQFSGKLLLLPFTATAYTTAVSVMSTKECSLDGNCKKIALAQEDASAFLASEGQIRGVNFQSALQAIRQANPALAASDMELAQVILAL